MCFFLLNKKLTVLSRLGNLVRCVVGKLDLVVRSGDGLLNRLGALVRLVIVVDWKFFVNEDTVEVEGDGKGCARA